MEGDANLPTSVTITRGILADLRIIKAEMSKAQNRTVHMPEVVQRLIGCWREKSGSGEKRDG